MGIIAKWSGDGVAGGTALGTTVGATTDTKFDTVVITSPTVCKVIADFSLYGPRLELLPNGLSGTTSPVHWWWQAALGAGPFPQHAVRFYIELADHPSGNAQIFSIRDSINIFMWWLDITATGVLRLRNNGGTALAISKASLPMNQTLRIEGTCNVGSVTVRVYRGDTIVPIETLVGTGVDKDSLGNTIVPAQCRFGTPNNANVLPHMYFDEMAFANTSDLIGPNWPSNPPFTVWDGVREVGADIYGLWDGTAVQQIQAAELAP